MANGNGKSLEAWIWDAACSIRGAKDAAKFKVFILPLIFTKRLCDVFDDEVSPIAEEVGSRAKAFKLYPVHIMTRKSFREMTRKLSVTESQRSAQFRGTV